MKLLSVDLDNIKSYTRARIDFTLGVNAVSGHNGSGKTTVLEAIGFALFDHLPYNHAAFVREGEKTGTVRVRVMADDEREYEIVRKVGSSSQYYVSDVESGTKLAERSQNVQEWVRANALGIDGDADLSALFENAVGVPQGKMTSDFLSSANGRKAVFDPLLRVEEYERAWENLRQTLTNVKDRMGAVREDIARLAVDVDRIPGLEDEAGTLRAAVAESTHVLEELAREIEDVRGQREALDRLQADVQAMQEVLRAQEYEVRRQEDWLRANREKLEKAQASTRALEESETGYRMVLTARETLEVLDAEQRQADELRRQKDVAQHAMIEIQSHIERLDADRRRALEDGDAAAALAPSVQRQGELEDELREAEILARERQKLDAEQSRMRKEIAELETAQSQRERRLADARLAQEAAGKLAELQRERGDVVAALAGIDSLRDQFKATREEGERLRAQHDALQEQVQRWGALTQTIKERRPMADQAEALERRDRALNEERIRINAALEYQTIARAELERERCPLLELRCPVVASDGETLDRFDGRVAELAGRLEALDEERSTLSPQVAIARAAATEIQSLAVEAARLESSRDQLRAIDGDLERCRERYAVMGRTMGREKDLRSHLGSLDREIEHRQQQEKLAGQIPAFEEQLRTDAARLQGRISDLEQLDARRRELDAVVERLRSLQEELRALGDPRAKQQRLLVMASRRPDIEEQLQHDQVRLKEQHDKAQATAGALEAFSGLEDRIAEQRRIVAENTPAYERYMQNEMEARALEERQAALDETQRALDVARAGEQVAKKDLDEALAAYDPELHRHSAARHEALRQELGAADARHTTLQRDLARVGEDLGYCRRQEEKLRGHEAELNTLGRTDRAVRFIRDTIRQAGPTLTETLLANISQIANEIYAEIMDDHAVELRWDRDYEVLVRRGPEDRKFAQLSGGEQMSAALALRLALLKEMSEVDVAFFDEPTQNMDTDRRSNLADQIRQVRGFNQLIVISHDDTFEHHTDNLIRLVKDEDETRLEG